MQERMNESGVASPYDAPRGPGKSTDAWHELLAMALHDLSGAISIVHGTVQLWRRGGRVHGSPAQDWASVDAASGRAVRLSRELLDLCRTGHSGFRLDRRPVELVGLVQGIVERRRPLFEAAGQWLWAEVPDAPIWLAADRDQLGRVIDNLLDNAAKYTGTGGHVTVGVGRRGCDAAVKVQDTGVGMPPEFVSRAFEPFTREDSSAVRACPGSGVGLLAVRRIVELHGGRTEAASRGRGLGSEFTVWLPVTLEPEPAAADRARSQAS